MKAPILLFLLILPPQARQDDPLSALRKDVGTDFACESVGKVALIASNLEEEKHAKFRDTILGLLAKIEEQAFTPSLKPPLVIVGFRNEESFKAYAQKHPGESIIPPGFYEPARRRLIALEDYASSYAPPLLTGLLLSDYLETSSPPPWIISGLAVLEGGKETSLFDPRAALLRTQWSNRRGPSLGELLRMNLDRYHGGGPSHASYFHFPRGVEIPSETRPAQKVLRGVSKDVS